MGPRARRRRCSPGIHLALVERIGSAFGWIVRSTPGPLAVMPAWAFGGLVAAALVPNQKDA